VAEKRLKTTALDSLRSELQSLHRARPRLLGIVKLIQGDLSSLLEDCVDIGSLASVTRRVATLIHRVKALADQCAVRTALSSCTCFHRTNLHCVELIAAALSGNYTVSECRWILDELLKTGLFWQHGS